MPISTLSELEPKLQLLIPTFYQMLINDSSSDGSGIWVPATYMRDLGCTASCNCQGHLGNESTDRRASGLISAFSSFLPLPPCASQRKSNFKIHYQISLNRGKCCSITGKVIYCNPTILYRSQFLPQLFYFQASSKLMVWEKHWKNSSSAYIPVTYMWDLEKALGLWLQPGQPSPSRSSEKWIRILKISISPSLILFQINKRIFEKNLNTQISLKRY